MERNIFRASARKEMISRTFHLDSGQLESLQKVSKKLGISQSEMVRRSISYFTEEYAKQSKKK